MNDILGWLLDTSGFVPRKDCGDWSAGLLWLHAGSDLFIWLAYLSIPLVLIYFVRRRRDLPFARLFVLFALFILACGFTHFIDALIFHYPVYRLSGAVKLLTAVVSWATVLVLVPAVPKVLELVAAVSAARSETAVHRRLAAREPSRLRDYIVAVLAAVMALLLRRLFDPVLGENLPYVFAMLAVIFVAWESGFGPALVCLFIGCVTTGFWFVPPRETLLITAPEHQVGLALFFFSGVMCALLGEAQRRSRGRAEHALAESQARRAELEAEVARRREVELALRQRTAELAESEARFRSIVDHSPGSLYLKTADGRYLVANRGFAADVGRPAEEVVGMTDAELFPPHLADWFREQDRRVLAAGKALTFEDDFEFNGRAFTFLTTKFPLPDGTVGGIGTDITERKKAERERRQLLSLVESSSDLIGLADLHGRITYFNDAGLKLLGLDSLDEARTKTLADFVLPQDMAFLEGEMFPALRRYGRWEGEWKYRHARTGKAVPVSKKMVLLRDPQTGVPTAYATVSRDVTDRKRTEDALRESEERFRTLADSVPVLIWVSDLDARRTYFNKFWLEFTGRPLEDQVGGAWADAVHPDYREKYLATYHRAFAARKPFEIEYRLRRADGEYRWVLARGTPRFAPSGEFAGFVGLCIDITDRKTAAEALKASEERFRTLAEAVPPIVWVARPDGTTEYLNPRWAEFTGRPVEESLEERWAESVHPDDRPRAEAAWKAATAAGGGYEVQYRLRRADGEYQWFLVRATAQRDPNGTLLRWFGTCTNIHATKRLEEQLRQSLDRFRLLTEAIPQLVWNADAAGRVTYVNTRWKEYTGLTDGGAAGGWGGVVHPEEAADLTEAWERAAAGDPAPFSHEVRVRRADGEYRWFKAAVVPLLRDDGSVDQWIGSLSDIDDQMRQAETLERKVGERTAELERANAALRATAAELRRSNAELEKFAYVASHDLQEPLRKIQAFGDRLGARFRDALGDQGKDYLDRMLASAGRMRRLIDDLLSFSRVTTQAKAFEPVDLADTLRDVVADLDDRLTRSGGTVEVAGELPEVEADPTQMRQLFQNLVANALKFHRPGVPPVVRVRAEPDGPGNWRVAVEDNGIGFDERYRDRIFEVFQRLHGKDEYEGTGVGLAICKKIAERHGGSIAAAGTPGRGATFTVTLPARAGVNGAAATDDVSAAT